MLFHRETISPTLRLPSPDGYRHRFSIDRLRHGVDNLRYDVRISPSLVAAVREMALQLISKMSGVFELPDFNSQFNWQVKEIRFKQLCRDVLINAVNRAKLDNEPQVLYLALAAISSVFKDTVTDRYNSCLQHVKHMIWRSEVNYSHEMAVMLKEDLLALTRHRDRNLRRVNRHLFHYLSAALEEGVLDYQCIHFGNEALLPARFFDNPLIYEEDTFQDAFMIREYLLIGHRREDVHQYETFLTAITDVVRQLIIEGSDPEDDHLENAAGRKRRSIQDVDLDAWIKSETNIDWLFNVRDTDLQIGNGRSKSERRPLVELKKAQQARLETLQKAFHQRDLLRIVLAIPEIQDLCRSFSPPLTPHEILLYLVDGSSRRRVRDKLKRIKKSYGERLAMRPLKAAIVRIRRIPKKDRQQHLIDFVKVFCRYHRDLSDNTLLQEAIGNLNFLTDDKDLRLSRANRSLYDLLLPSEQSIDDAPIVGHVVLKADVRGSTGIVSEMKNKGLNPATNFSLNFFNPISKILSRYGAKKVFIEGDAIILSISEKENRPDQWYAVARCCGMAMAILLIVHRYNRKNLESDLPHLEIGIGVSYAGSAPTFFFDDDNPIMISPAINQADRLSSCFKSLRKRFTTLTPPFNVYVFKPIPEDRSLVPEPFIRYNVGGIELNVEGFEKLKREIQLTPLELTLPTVQREPIRIHVGSFPTVKGVQQALIIREAAIPLMSLKDMKIHGMTDHVYYEVCTHPAVYQTVKSSIA
jgi:hypothetical protein